MKGFENMMDMKRFEDMEDMKRNTTVYISAIPCYEQNVTPGQFLS